MRTYCRFFRAPVRRSSTSSMGEEEERRELSEGLKEGELLSPGSTDRELGLSSRACRRAQQKVKQSDGIRMLMARSRVTRRASAFISLSPISTEEPHLTAVHHRCVTLNYYPTILLFTSSSMALTNSAALGVSELDGRTDRRDEDWVKRIER